VLGLRWGEAVGLRGRDIDFLRRTVTVAQVVEELAGKLTIVAEAKTKASLRSLSAPPFLLDAIARHLAEHRGGVGIDPGALVFVGPRGGVLRRRFGERILRPAVKRAELPPGLTFHALRHAALTTMADAGVPYNVTQGRAGHATARMTMEVYSHRTTDADRAAADALEAHFGKAFSGGSGPSVARRTPRDLGTGA
jgi:integrase